MYHHYKLEKYIPKALILSYYSCQNSVFFAEKNPLDTSTIKFNLHTGCLPQWRSACPRCKDHPTPSLHVQLCFHSLPAAKPAPGPGHPPSPSAASGRSNLASLCCPSATFTATARQMAPSFLSKERTPASRVYLPSEKRYFNFG